jgi:hypothetical protein
MCAVMSALVALGCTDDSVEADKSSGTEAAAPRATGDNPAILFVERVYAPEQRLYYASVLSELPTTHVDRSKAREFGSADIDVYDGKLFVRDRETNTLTRFAVSEDNELVEEAQLSFADVGLQARRYHNVFLSPTRALVLNNIDWTLLGWNPSTMELTGEERSIAFAAKPKGVDGFISEPVPVGDRIMSAINWQNYDDLVMYPGSGALVFDPAADEDAPPQLIEDTRVGGGLRIKVDDNGDAYYIGAVRGEIIKFGKVFEDAPLPASGVLRIRNGETAFDPDYFVDVGEITKSPNIWAIHMIDAQHLLVQMWDPETPDDAAKAPGDLDGAREFIYAIVDIAAKRWERVANITKGGAGNSSDHVLDGQLYVQAYVTSDNSEQAEDAIVYGVTSDGVEEAFRVPAGDLWLIERIR